MLCDTLGFPDLEGYPPEFDPRIQMDLIHMTSSHPREKTLAGIEGHHNSFVRTLKEQDNVRIVGSKSEFSQLPPGTTGVLLGLQNPPQDVSAYRATNWMRANHIVFTTLAYNEETRLAGGYYCQNVGLKEPGKDLVRACGDNDIAVDLSHASLATAEGVMELTSAENLRTKVVATHVGMSALYDNPRNMPDHVLDWSVRRGGFIGVPFFTFFLDPADDSIACYVRHLRYAIEKFGKHAVCVGSDTPYAHRTREEHKDHFKKMSVELDPKKLTMHGRQALPELQHPYLYYSPLKLLMFKEEFFKHFSYREANAICGDNFWRWCEENLPD